MRFSLGISMPKIRAMILVGERIPRTPYADTASRTGAERAGCLAEDEGLTSGKSQFSGEFLRLRPEAIQFPENRKNLRFIMTRQNEGRP